MTEEELERLTPAERARMEASEREALRTLNRRMREDRWCPRRHMRFAPFVLVGLAAVCLHVLGVAWLLTWLGLVA